MKDHNVPAPVKHLVAEGGVMKSAGFTWPKQIKKAQAKAEYRAIQLARTNITYQMEHPSELRENPENKVLTCCHPEAAKRIAEKFLKIKQSSKVPLWEQPKRLNRVG